MPTLEPQILKSNSEQLFTAHSVSDLAEISALGNLHSILKKDKTILNNPLLNKGTAFSESERDTLGIRGLIPARVFTMAEQLERALTALRSKPTTLEKYIYLVSLQNRNEILYYRLVMEHMEEIIPLIYTPTVGEACLKYGSIYRRARGLFISRHDKGRIKEILRNWPNKSTRLIVVTDGERILGLGDLGANGMGIPIGKLSLYSACAGVHPSYTLPITLDVGCNTKNLLSDPSYIGIQEERLRGKDYDSLIEEFITAVKEVFPKALLQWEDFGNSTAFHLLEKYRKALPSFNDDIQGTAAVALAGVIAALKLTNSQLSEQKILFLGAGEAGTGIADLCVAAMQEEGLSPAKARNKCWFVDSQGLVVKSRYETLAHHKLPYAHEHKSIQHLIDAVKELKPTILIGVSAQPATFTEEVIQYMSKINNRPIIFALSNPTSKSECTAEQAYTWSNGAAIFASGSAFAPIQFNGKRIVPGQGNNVYIFPGIGLGALVSESTEITNKMFLTAAQTLAKLVTPEDLKEGRVYPPLNTIRDVSLEIATAVATEAYQSGTARAKHPANIKEDIKNRMFQPEYITYT